MATLETRDLWTTGIGTEKRKRDQSTSESKEWEYWSGKWTTQNQSHKTGGREGRGKASVPGAGKWTYKSRRRTQGISVQSKRGAPASRTTVRGSCCMDALSAGLEREFWSARTADWLGEKIVGDESTLRKRRWTGRKAFVWKWSTSNSTWDVQSTQNTSFQEPKQRPLIHL